MLSEQKDCICKSIFKNGKPEPTSQQVTAIWTVLINRLEKSKIITAGN